MGGVSNVVKVKLAIGGRAGRTRAADSVGAV